MENVNPGDAACDSGFPQGQDIVIKQRYEGMGENKVILWMDGKTLVYESSDYGPYKYCRESHKAKIVTLGEDKEYNLDECFTFKNSDFELTVKYYNP